MQERESGRAPAARLRDRLADAPHDRADDRFTPIRTAALGVVIVLLFAAVTHTIYWLGFVFTALVVGALLCACPEATVKRLTLAALWRLPLGCDLYDFVQRRLDDDASAATVA